MGDVHHPAIVVVWRGQPGWMFQDDDPEAANTLSFSGGTDFSRGPSLVPLSTVSVKQGAVRLEIAYVHATRELTLNGIPVDLPEGHDVVLVDDVDAAPVVVDTIRIGGSEPEWVAPPHPGHGRAAPPSPRRRRPHSMATFSDSTTRGGWQVLEPPVVEPRVEAAARPSPGARPGRPRRNRGEEPRQVLWQTRRPPPASPMTSAARPGRGRSAMADAASAPDSKGEPSPESARIAHHPDPRPEATGERGPPDSRRTARPATILRSPGDLP